jgi:hypothetical protein
MSQPQQQAMGGPTTGLQDAAKATAKAMSTITAMVRQDDRIMMIDRNNNKVGSATRKIFVVCMYYTKLVLLQNTSILRRYSTNWYARKIIFAPVHEFNSGCKSRSRMQYQGYSPRI